MKDLYDLCLKVLKSRKLRYGEDDGFIYIPFTSDDGVHTSIKLEIHKSKQIIFEIWWVKHTIPSDRLNSVLEFMGRVNDIKVFTHLRLDFNDMTLAVTSSNAFGEKLDYDTVEEILITYIYSAVRLFNFCSPPFLEILGDDIDAETAFQKFRELDEKH